MAHVVCLTRGLYGLLHACFALLDQVRDSGHRVTVMTLVDVGGAVRAEGYEHVLLPEQHRMSTESALATKDDERPAGLRARARRFRRRGERRAAAAAATEPVGFAETLDELAPDLLLIDAELHAHIMMAARRPAPLALVTTFYAPYERPSVPPLHRFVVPGQGWRGTRAGIAAAWVRYRASKHYRRWRERYLHDGIDRVDVFRRYAQRLGFPFDDAVALGAWPIPFGYRSLPLLSLTSDTFDFPHRPPPHVRHTGAMVHLGRTDTRLDASERRRLDAVLRARRGRPLVVGAFSTFAKQRPAFLERLIGAATAIPEWDFLLSLGGRTAAQDWATPDHLHVFEWLPVLEALDAADLTITNAGTNTICESLFFGVPLVVYSLGTNNQEGTAARVVYHGVGIVGSMDDDDAETIERDLRAAMDTPRYRRRAAWFAEAFQAEREERRGADAVEALLGATAASTSR